jgi:hypothetical protein
MNYLIYAVGDRVRLRHPAPQSRSHRIGTVTMVFGTAHGYYDVQFDTALGPRILHASDIERNTAVVLWVDDAHACPMLPRTCTICPQDFRRGSHGWCGAWDGVRWCGAKASRRRQDNGSRCAHEQQKP